jgi:translation initiation factor 1
MMRLFEGTAWDQGPPKCERCGQLESECQCPPAPPPRVAPGKQTARVQVEKRKAGRVVTVIRGLAPADNDLPALLTVLKNACGAGGTVREDSLEIQGDQLQRVKEELAVIGYKVR